MVKFRIGFSYSKKWYGIFSWLIKAVEKRKFSHAFVEIQDPFSQQYIIAQASGFSVNMTTPSNFLKESEPTHYYEVSCSIEEFAAVWSYLLSKMGNPYGILTILKITWYGKILRKSFKGDGEMTDICSELIAKVSEMVKIEVPVQDKDNVTPSMLDKFLSIAAEKVPERIKKV